jgi:hypothetical protein
LLFSGLLASSLGGCYAHHTADEDLLDVAFPDQVYPDAGTSVTKDAGTGCTQTDPIQLLICQFSQGAGGLGNLGDLGNLGNLGNLGSGTGTDTGTGTGQPDLGAIGDLIDQFLGGGSNSGTGNNGTANGLQDILDLLGSLTGQGRTPSNPLQDLLDGLGIPTRDAGAAQQMMSQINEATCAKATDAQTRFLCTISGFATPAQGRRDAGTGFPWPIFPTAKDAGTVSTVDAGPPQFVF